MSTTILISNIGNRNITYKGSTYPSFSKDVKGILGSFREWTEQLWKNFDDKKEHIQLNIIDTLIEERKNEINKIYLFYSDHPEGERNDQDTLYEAEIMKAIIEEKYQIQTELKKVKAVVVDNNGLLRFYRNTLRAIDKLNTQPYIIVCDAGGTAQQKSALKILLEFTFPENRYEVQYVNYGVLQKIEPIEYRNIINTEQAVSLIEDGQYYSAIKLLGFGTPDLARNQKDKNFKLLAHVFFRFHSNHEEAFSNIQGKLALENPLLDAYLKKQAFVDNNPLKEIIGELNFLRVVERFYKVLFLYRLGKWSSTILALSQFYENLFELSYEDMKNTHTNLESNFREKYDSFITNFNRDKPMENHYRINGTNVAVRCMFSKMSTNKTISNIAELISPYLTFTNNSVAHEYALNYLRNKIAHEGRIITNTEKETHINFLDSLIVDISKVLRITKDDLFKELNEFVINRIRKS